jgi:azurin
MDRSKWMGVFSLMGLAAMASPSFAQAPACKLEIAGNDMMQFDRKELRASAACKEVEIVLKHSGKLPLAAMGHNVVLTKTADAQAVSNAGITAGIKNNHVPVGDKRVIAASKMIGGGQTTSVKVPMAGLQKGGDYTYFCSFPGHYGIMKGKFVVQ